MAELIIGAVLAIIISFYFFGVEKKIKANPIILMVAVVLTLGFGGYILGSAENFTIPNIFLILLFFGGGIWRLWQLITLKTPL